MTALGANFIQFDSATRTVLRIPRNDIGAIVAYHKLFSAIPSPASLSTVIRVIAGAITRSRVREFNTFLYN